MRQASMDEQVQTTYRNYFECAECGTKWTDECDCPSNNCCPKCSVETEPYDSIEL